MNMSHHLSRLPGVYLVIIAINVLLFVAQVVSGVGPMSPETAELVAWGANIASRTLLGESWRLLTSMFLHVGLVHLLFNMYMLFALGRIVERQFGPLRFLLTYLLSGLAGSLVSALYHADPGNVAVSAGASGALMGICGAFLAERLIAAARHQDQEAMGMRGPLSQTIGINLLLGFIIPGVDNACHIGGLIGGAIVGTAFTLARFKASKAKNAAANIAITLVSLLCMQLVLNRAPSPGLIQLARQKVMEQGRLDAANRLKKTRAAITAEIAQDRKNAAPAVSAHIAAGRRIALDRGTSYLHVSPDGQRLYVAGEVDNTLKLIDAGAAKVVATVTGPPSPDPAGWCPDYSCSGRGASALAFSPDEQIAYVTSMVKNGIGIVDLKTNKMTGSIKTGEFPRAIAVSASGERAYVLNAGDDTIVALDLVAKRVIGKPFEVSEGDKKELVLERVVGIWLAAGERELWVLDETGMRLLVLDAASLKPLASIALTAESLRGAHVNAKLGTAWALGARSLDIIDLSRRAIRAVIPICAELMNESAMAVSHDGSMLAVAGAIANGTPIALRLIKLRTGKIVGSYPINATPQALRFSPDGKQLYLLTNHASGLSIIDTAKSVSLAAIDEENGELFCARPVSAQR